MSIVEAWLATFGQIVGAADLTNPQARDVATFLGRHAADIAAVLECRCDGERELIVVDLLTGAPQALYAPRAGAAPWSGLTGVPNDFADGTDEDARYTIGPGLDLTGETLGLKLAGSGSAGAAARSDHTHTGFLRGDQSSSFKSGTLTLASGTTLAIQGALLLPPGSITDAMVSDTLTSSDLVASGPVVSDAEAEDSLTIRGGSIENTPIGQSRGIPCSSR